MSTTTFPRALAAALRARQGSALHCETLADAIDEACEAVEPVSSAPDMVLKLDSAGQEFFGMTINGRRGRIERSSALGTELRRLLGDAQQVTLEIRRKP